MHSLEGLLVNRIWEVRDPNLIQSSLDSDSEQTRELCASGVDRDTKDFAVLLGGERDDVWRVEGRQGFSGGHG